MLPVEFHILLSLAVGDRHGYGLAQDMQDRGERAAPSDGTMYRALARLAKAGLIEVAPTALTGGEERRKYYRITRAGRRAAADEARRLDALVQAARRGGLLSESKRSHG